MTIRQALCACALSLGAMTISAAAAAQPVAAAPAAVGPVVKIRQGALQGVATDGVAVFSGIPYAAPPVGDLRWRAPQPAAGWTGVRDAGQPAAACAKSE